MRTHLEDLHLEIETLRQRCDAFEAAFGPGDAWSTPVPPLTLYQTRVMRLIAKREMTGNDALRILASYYPSTSDNALDSQLVNIRRAMPFDIAPRLRRSKFDYLSVPDRDALKAFLASGQMPMARAA